MNNRLSPPGPFAMALLTVFFGLVGVCRADFDYVVNPPNVAVDPSTSIPQVLPHCSSFFCYSPPFIRAAYNYPSNLDGTGQTILIVDAFGSPTIANDLKRFDAIFGIPDPPSFTILCPEEGCPPFDPNDTHHHTLNWSLETSLDVEWAHAMAPGAAIVLVVASTSSGSAINSAEAAAIKKYPGSIMSQSFGIPEIAVHADDAQIKQAHRNYQAAQSANITVLASAGDFGATNGSTVANPGYPSSDPLVLAVGGTQGHPYPGGLVALSGNTPVGYGDEEVWNEPRFGAATGGAPSLFFGVPSFQSGLGLSSRTTPDVSYNAAVNGGVLVLDTTLSTRGFFIVGGTSAGSPQWAAICALANQSAGRSLGFINGAIYQVAASGSYSTDFHDITIGNNQLVGTPVGFSAASGFDGASGWGTPNVTALIPDLIAAAH